MISKQKLNSVVTEVFTRGTKFNKPLVFITQSYFKVPKDVRLNSTHFFIMKNPNKRELRRIALNHSSDIDHEKIIQKFLHKSVYFRLAFKSHFFRGPA